MDASSINLTDPQFWASGDRAAAFRTLRDECPVSWQDFAPGPEEGTKGFWAVTRYDDIVAVSSDARTYINGQGVTLTDAPGEILRAEGFFLQMDAPEHFKLRQISAKAFSPSGVQKMRWLAESHAKELVASVKANGGCDFAHDLAHVFPVTVVTEYLGAPREYRQRLLEATVIALSVDVVGPEAAIAAYEELNGIGTELAIARRKRPCDDVMSIIAAAEVDGQKLSEEDAGYYFQLLVTAGIETTGTTAAHLMRLFLENPDQMALWEADPIKVAPTGVEEAVRLATPVIHFRRTATVDTELNGQKIAAGDKVVMWYLSGNQDERKFEDPLRFDVMRNPNPHLGFGGGGRHNCLGAHFARMELPFLFSETLSQLTNIEPAGDPVFVPSRFVNGISSLPVRFKAK